MVRRMPRAIADVRVAVVIPAYEASSTIGDVVARVHAVMPHAAVIVVDDGSSDGTGAAAQAQRGAALLLLTHPRNRGKGVALGTGIAAAVSDHADVIVTLDADGQHPPQSIPELVAPVLAGTADVALGARRRANPMPLGRQFTNWLSATLASRVGGAGQDVRDAQTGFRAFTADVARRIRPAERHYDFETAFLLQALAAGCRVTSVTIPTVYEGRASHFRAWVDTWRLTRVFARHARQIVAGGGRT
jgi:glycosyltransferase involved in cell wall biosynthesis